jgi:transposase-like protein
LTKWYIPIIVCGIYQKGGVMAGEHGRCPNCGGDHVVKAGKYNRGLKGVEQRYLCKGCHKFTTKPIQQLQLIKAQDLLR